MERVETDLLRIYLDDVRPCPEGWHPAYTAREVFHLVSISSEVAEMSLDHDLGPSSAGNGMDVVEWMMKTGKWPLRKPRVHSANAIEGPKMVELIERHGPYDGSGALMSLPPRHRSGHALGKHLGTHTSCPDPACCRCACPGCMAEWRRSQKPGPLDCDLEGDRS